MQQELKAIQEEKQLYASGESEMATPQFTTNNYLTNEDHYNPFSKKYSEQYMGQYYDKQMQFDKLSQKQEHIFCNDYPKTDDSEFSLGLIPGQSPTSNHYADLYTFKSSLQDEDTTSKPIRTTI